MTKHIWLGIAMTALLLPSVLPAQDKMAPPSGQGGGPIQVQPGRPQIQPPRPDNGGPQIQPPRPVNGGPQIQPPRPGNGGPQIQPPRPERPRPPVIVRPPHQGGGYHRPPHYRPPHYYYPSGYHYRRWTAGVVLPALLFRSSYYFTDYHRFGLASPPRHFRWIRFGPDLLLVNIRTGRIRTIHYGVFR